MQTYLNFELKELVPACFYLSVSEVVGTRDHVRSCFKFISITERRYFLINEKR